MKKPQLPGVREHKKIRSYGPRWFQTDIKYAINPPLVFWAKLRAKSQSWSKCHFWLQLSTASSDWGLNGDGLTARDMPGQQGTRPNQTNPGWVCAGFEVSLSRRWPLNRLFRWILTVWRFTFNGPNSRLEHPAEFRNTQHRNKRRMAVPTNYSSPSDSPCGRRCDEPHHSTPQFARAFGG